MNDFSIDELEFLKHSVREHYKNNRPIKGSTYVNIWAEMINKLQSMIEDYCEHEKTVPNYDCKTQCEKCFAIL